MALAHLISVDENALICDFAEVYHIWDYKRLPVRTAAILAAGLDEDSRIKRKISGNKIPTGILLMSAMLDAMNLLVWMQTKDGQKGNNRPRSVIKAITDEPSEVQGFRTAEDFERERNRIIARKKVKKHGDGVSESIRSDRAVSKGNPWGDHERTGR